MEVVCVCGWDVGDDWMDGLSHSSLVGGCVTHFPIESCLCLFFLLLLCVWIGFDVWVVD